MIIEETFKMTNKKSYFKYFTSMLMFGMNGIVASCIALNSYEIVFTRTLIGSLFLLAIFLVTRQKAHLFQNKKHLLCLALSGIAMGISWMFLFEAYQQIGVSIATLAYYCGPVFMMILSPILFHEKLTPAKLTGFFAVLLGMFCVNVQALNEEKTVWGLFCGIMSAVTYALMVIFNKKAKSITGLENSMWQLLTAFLTVAVFVGIKQGLVIRIQPGSWIPVLILGIVNTGIGCYFYFSSIGDLPVQTVAVCSYLDPLSAVVFAVLFLKESMSIIQVIGAVLILGGAVLGELFDWKNNKAENAHIPPILGKSE